MLEKKSFSILQHDKSGFADYELIRRRNGKKCNKLKRGSERHRPHRQLLSSPEHGSHLCSLPAHPRAPGTEGVPSSARTSPLAFGKHTVMGWLLHVYKVHGMVESDRLH